MYDVIPLLYVTALGFVIGSFLNVVIYRYNTNKSLNGRSHCLTCGVHLSWRELIPVLSYLIQSGRCRHCSARFSARYLFVEVCTGMLFAGLWVVTSDLFIFVGMASLLCVLVVITVYDMRHMIIPDRLVLSLLGVVIILETYLLAIGVHTVSDTIIGVCSGIASGGFFAGLWLVSKGRWIGLGDAKLAVPLGVIVSFPGAISMVILSFWIGALVSLVLLALAHISMRGKHLLRFLSLRLTIKQEIPFAPFLISAFLLVYFFNTNVFEVTDAVLRFFL